MSIRGWAAAAAVLCTAYTGLAAAAGYFAWLLVPRSPLPYLVLGLAATGAPTGTVLAALIWRMTWKADQ